MAIAPVTPAYHSLVDELGISGAHFQNCKLLNANAWLERYIPHPFDTPSFADVITPIFKTADERSIALTGKTVAERISRANARRQ